MLLKHISKPLYPLLGVFLYSRSRLNLFFFFKLKSYLFVLILFEDSGFSFETLPTTFMFIIIVFQETGAKQIKQ